MRTQALRVAFLMGLGALLATACGGPKFSEYCTALQQCAGGNPKDVSACEDNAQGAYNAANDYGCGSAADQYADCVNQKFSCSTGLDACSSLATAMSSCECAASANCNVSCPTSCSADRSICCSAGVTGCC